MLQDLLPAHQVGQVHRDLAVEAAGPQERRIEHFGPVGGRHHDHAVLRLETVHLGQQLVEGLFPFLVRAHGAGAGPPAADGVELVDEDDAGRGLLGLLEQVTHA